MKKTGPWQHCNKCNKSTSHYWDETNLIRCRDCNKDTKIPDREPIVAGTEHLHKEEAEDLKKVLASEPVPEVKAEVKEVKIPEGAIAVQTELPKQGHEVKATPLDNMVKEIAESVSKEHNIPAEVLEVSIDRDLVQEMLDYKPKRENYGTTSHGVVILDFSEEPKEEVKPEPSNWANLF